ncbi:hypothetical protein [Halodesulfovibrio marinisediminis]|uniref:Uncharacterized protein n=1 Tax=Halodesulfovibrio marinisediminis DSM 17456 TaxID=1121457 RepID=A0A1N6G1U9_9BACT|nr:hypothetical protein [Halodesulfovibrio marinisediminis]SIO01529.1 hypothetical protein SAMN02745161_1635 [Halodesulfovibrio marinisediminis DSM 17456]
MTMFSESNGMRVFMLPNDIGADMEFTGVLCSENSYHDQEAGTITKQRLYLTDTKDQIYSVVVSDGVNKDQRVYKMRVEKDQCRIDNGLFDVALDLHLLASVVRGLCGLDCTSHADDFFSTMVENLQAANG